MTKFTIPFFEGIILLCGNIGTGKSRFAKDFIDSYHTEKVRHFELESYLRKLNIEPDMRESVLEKDLLTWFEIKKTVIIDGTNFTKKNRAQFIRIAKNLNVAIYCIDFGPGNAISLERIVSENSNLTASDRSFIHENNISRYEKPVEEEGFSRIFVVNH